MASCLALQSFEGLDSLEYFKVCKTLKYSSFTPESLKISKIFRDSGVKLEYFKVLQTLKYSRLSSPSKL